MASRYAGGESRSIASEVERSKSGSLEGSAEASAAVGTRRRPPNLLASLLAGLLWDLVLVVLDVAEGLAAAFVAALTVHVEEEGASVAAFVTGHPVVDMAVAAGSAIKVVALAAHLKVLQLVPVPPGVVVDLVAVDMKTDLMATVVVVAAAAAEEEAMVAQIDREATWNR